MQQPTFNFDLDYAGAPVNCRVVMEDRGYSLFFDARLMATIAHTDDMEWIQESGVILPEEIIDEIASQRWQITNPAGLWVTLLVVLFSLWMPIFWGVLQGKQSFLWLGWSMN